VVDERDPAGKKTRRYLLAEAPEMLSRPSRLSQASKFKGLQWDEIPSFPSRLKMPSRVIPD